MSDKFSEQNPFKDLTNIKLNIVEDILIVKLFITVKSNKSFPS